jgi:pyruvate ferredoxin oxidoreductase alpha subunit
VVATEVRAALYNADHRPPLIGFICGLGGREVTLEDVYKVAEICYTAAQAGRAEKATYWLGVRE